MRACFAIPCRRIIDGRQGGYFPATNAIHLFSLTLDKGGDMHIPRLTAAALILALAGIYLQAQPPEQKITVTGKLVRAMAIGAESTGWTLEFDSPTNIGGRQMNSIPVSYPKTRKLEKLNNKYVTATGELTHRHGVETGEQVVLEVSSIKQ